MVQEMSSLHIHRIERLHELLVSVRNMNNEDKDIFLKVLAVVT